MLIQSLIKLVPIYLFFSVVDAQKTNEILDAKTDKFINQILKDWKSPGGLAIAYVKKDSNGNWVNIETKGYGRATASNKSVTEKTLFNIASNSKLFTVAATGLLVNNKTVSPQFTWNSRVSTVVPEFGVTDPITATKARFIDLLSHRTGYPRHDFAYTYNDNVSTVLQKMHYWRQSYEFRDVWQLNNNMYTLMGALPPKLAGKSFGRYVKDNIFTPLGLNSTTYSYQIANATGNRADGMGRQNWNLYSGDVFAGTPAATKWWSGTTGGEDGNVLAASNGVISNAVDMATWLQTLLLDGRHPKTNKTIISSAIVQKAALAVIPQSYQPSFPELSLISYGSAQTQITYRNHLIIEHAGSVRGFNSQVSRLPNDGVGVAVLTNDNEYGQLISQLVKYYIMDRSLGFTPIDWSTRLMAQVTTPPPKATPRPVNATLPSVNFTTLAGMYNNAGYGTVELCYTANISPPATATCSVLVQSLTTILPGSIRTGIPTLVGAIDSPWFSHIRIEHFNNNLFNVSYLLSTAQNNTRQPFWTYNNHSASDNGATAEVQSVNGHVGIGLAGMWAGLWVPNVAPATPKPQGNTVRARAEVYWDKV